MEADDIGADDGAEVEALLSGYAEAEARSIGASVRAGRQEQRKDLSHDL